MLFRRDTRPFANGLEFGRVCVRVYADGHEELETYELLRDTFGRRCWRVWTEQGGWVVT